MACDCGYYWLFGILAVQILSNIDHCRVSVHSWHVKIHQNQIKSCLSQNIAFKVIFHQFESLFARQSLSAIDLSVQADAIVKNYFKSFNVERLVINNQDPLILGWTKGIFLAVIVVDGWDGYQTLNPFYNALIFSIHFDILCLNDLIFGAPVEDQLMNV